MSAQRVLVTGAAGALGTLVLDALPAEGFDVRGFDVAEPPAGARADFLRGSVTDLDALVGACAGVSAVLHLAGASTPEADWETCLSVNIDGTRSVLEAARRAGVSRVVLASSNHAVGFVPRSDGVAAADVEVRPDSPYGVSKAAAEALASFYADQFGMRTASLRIGSCFPRPTSTRMLATWLSPADLVRLVLATLRADWSGHIRVWGVSRNRRRWWSLEEGERIGYRPQDDAEVFAADVPPADERFAGGFVPFDAR